MLVKKTMAAAMLLLISTVTLAANPMTVCPTIDMLKSFDGDLVHSFPTGIDQNSGIVMSVIQNRDFTHDGGAFAGYGKLFFILSGIIIHPEEDAENNAQALLSQMQMDNETPFIFQAFKDTFIPVCSYSLPGDGTVKAVVYQMPNHKKPTSSIA